MFITLIVPDEPTNQRKSDWFKGVNVEVEWITSVSGDCWYEEFFLMKPPPHKVWLNVYYFVSGSRISYTKRRYHCRLRALTRRLKLENTEGSLSCRTCLDKGPLFVRSHVTNRPTTVSSCTPSDPKQDIKFTSTILS